MIRQDDLGTTTPHVASEGQPPESVATGSGAADIGSHVANTASPWLTAEQAAAYVHLNRAVLLRKRRRGELAGVRCGSNGKAILFHQGDLDAWLQGEGRLE